VTDFKSKQNTSTKEGDLNALSILIRDFATEREKFDLHSEQSQFRHEFLQVASDAITCVHDAGILVKTTKSSELTEEQFEALGSNSRNRTGEWKKLPGGGFVQFDKDGKVTGRIMRNQQADQA
jgi:hypothetical protein